MVKKNENNTDAATMAAQTHQQPEGTTGEQLDTSVNTVSTTVPETVTSPTPDPTTETMLQQTEPGEIPVQTAGVADIPATLDLPPEKTLLQAESGAAVGALPTKAATEPRCTIQAVAVPNKRRMRAGRVFTEEPTEVYQSEFSESQWRAIWNDPHLKIIPHGN